MNNVGTSRWVRALQASSVALGVVASCTVVDKDDYTFRDGDAGAGGEAPGGAAGKGGTSGKGGASGASGKGGTSGRGGSSGGGSAGAPGEGGEAGVPGGSAGEGGGGGQPAGECGDGTQDPGEDCDDGNRVDEECDYFATTCSGCSRSCRRIRAPSCGDGAVNGAHATSITLEYAATSCAGTPGVPLWLNGVAIPSLPWGTVCSCGTGVQTVEVTDDAVLAALRQDNNYLSFTTPATNEYIAWVMLTAVFDNGTRVSKVALDIGAPGDAEARNPGVASCPDPYAFLSLGAAVGTAFGGFPVEQCDGGSDCYACAVPQCVTLTSSPAVAIPDYDSVGSLPGTIQDALILPEVGTVRDVDVSINVTHTFDQDLGISIVSPLNSVSLAERVGTSGDNFTDTLFDSACTTPIASGVAPFTGCFAPFVTLDTFNGTQQTFGAWNLKILDNASTDTGTLNSWKIKVCGVP